MAMGVRGRPIPTDLDSQHCKPLLNNSAACVKKVAVSKNPRSAGKVGGAVMGYSIRDERHRRPSQPESGVGTRAGTGRCGSPPRVNFSRATRMPSMASTRNS